MAVYWGLTLLRMLGTGMKTLSQTLRMRGRWIYATIDLAGNVEARFSSMGQAVMGVAVILHLLHLNEGHCRE